MKLEILVKYTDDKNEFFILKEDISAKIDEKASLILKHVLPLLTALADKSSIDCLLKKLINDTDITFEKIKKATTVEEVNAIEPIASIIGEDVELPKHHHEVKV